MKLETHQRRIAEVHKGTISGSYLFDGFHIVQCLVPWVVFFSFWALDFIFQVPPPHNLLQELIKPVIGVQERHWLHFFGLPIWGSEKV